MYKMEDGTSREELKEIKCIGIKGRRGEKNGSCKNES